MTIEDAAVIDGAGLDKSTGDVVLTISDHLLGRSARSLPASRGKDRQILGFRAKRPSMGSSPMQPADRFASI